MLKMDEYKNGSSLNKERLRRLIISRCVEFRDSGFVLASGKVSKLYIDLRRLTMDPLGINLIGNLVLNKIYEIAPTADCIGGLETGSIPIAASVALLSLGQKKELKAFWVRKQQKDHGLQNLIEGNISRGSNAVIVDDTITTGGSSITAVQVVKEFGANVLYAIGIVDRGASENFQKSKIPYFAFFTEKDLGAS
jgi:orotate phosphoribosyltransferase